MVDPVTVDYVREVARTIQIPFVAIGGIKLHNVDEVIAAGATRICAVSEIVGSADVRGTCQAFLRQAGREVNSMELIINGKSYSLSRSLLFRTSSSILT